MKIYEAIAEIHLHSLVSHTLKRIFHIQQCNSNIFSALRGGTLRDVGTVFKWDYNDEQLGNENPDERLFVSALVPLQVHVGKEKKVIWENRYPSWKRYCRPVKFCFYSTWRSQNRVEHEKRCMEKQIAALQPTVYHIDGKDFSINHSFTPLETKNETNALLRTLQASPHTCYFCRAKLKGKFIERNDAPPYEFSVVRASICMFECLLEIASRLQIKRWQLKSADKPLVERRLKELQKEFRKRLDLIVHAPHAKDELLNDGHTARKFFKNPRISAEITGLSEELISKFHVILRAVSCGERIKGYAFKEYAREVAELYVKEYGWFHMPVMVHEILIHGHLIISCDEVPVRQLSKEIESVRADSRKVKDCLPKIWSGEETNLKILKKLLVYSDPLISSLSNRRLRRADFPEGLLDLLDFGTKEREKEFLDKLVDDEDGGESDSDIEDY